ncbi:MAG: hypothetical protein R3D67_09760 [Hyphomicrobiaceae bacterium]
MIRRDGQPVLIDFGSARGDIAKHSKTISALVKPGYSPFEQYATTSRQQGPWTDIYSLGATLYEAVTNKRPPDAPSRMVHDEMIPPADAALSSYRPAFLAAIARSLRLEVAERPRTVADWRAELMAEPARKQPVHDNAPAAAASEPDAAKAPAGATPPAAQQGAKKAAKKQPPASASSSPASAVAADCAPKIASEAAPALDVRSPKSSHSGGERKGLADAFLAGWRKAAPSEPDSIRAANPQPKPQPREAAPADAAKPASKPPAPKATAEPEPAPHGEPDAAAPATAIDAPAELKPVPVPRIFSRKSKANAVIPAAPTPGARKATPRALRRRSAARWQGLLVKLLIGIMVAAAAVAIQDKLPVVRREGAGLFTSQTGIDVALARISAHKAAVTGIAYAADGATLISASADGTLKVWDAAHGNLQRTFELDGGPATAFAIADGRAATAHQDGTITVYSLTTGEKIATMKSSDTAVLALTFAGSNTRLAAAGDGKVTLWDTGQPATLYSISMVTTASSPIWPSRPAAPSLPLVARTRPSSSGRSQRTSWCAPTPATTPPSPPWFSTRPAPFSPLLAAMARSASGRPTPNGSSGASAAIKVASRPSPSHPTANTSRPVAPMRPFASGVHRPANSAAHSRPHPPL